jgi:hypothetical protein
MPNDKTMMVARPADAPHVDRDGRIVHDKQAMRRFSRRQMIIAFILFNIAVWALVLFLILR